RRSFSSALMMIRYSTSIFLLALIFFFSSRRRHTRCYRDWSSDVCSSDLAPFRSAQRTVDRSRAGIEPVVLRCEAYEDPAGLPWRSEERRVGKECGDRRSECHEKKKENKENSKKGDTSTKIRHSEVASEYT